MKKLLFIFGLVSLTASSSFAAAVYDCQEAGHFYHHKAQLELTVDSKSLKKIVIKTDRIDTIEGSNILLAYPGMNKPGKFKGYSFSRGMILFELDPEMLKEKPGPFHEVKMKATGDWAPEFECIRR